MLLWAEWMNSLSYFTKEEVQYIYIYIMVNYCKDYTILFLLLAGCWGFIFWISVDIINFIASLACKLGWEWKSKEYFCRFSFNLMAYSFRGQLIWYIMLVVGSLSMNGHRFMHLVFGYMTMYLGASISLFYV